MSNRRELALFVFIDAFGHRLLRRQAFLDDWLPVKRPLGTVFGYSSTCDPTILTGLAPRDHGHFSFFVYNPAASPFGICRYLSLLPAAVTRRGRVRRLLSRLIGRAYGYTGYFQIYNMPFRYLPLFEYTEKRDLYQPGGIISGAPTPFDHLRDNGIPFYLSDWRASEARNLAALERSLAEGKIRFAYLYLAAMDAILHAHGADSAAGAAKIRWYEQQLRPLLEQARAAYDEVHLYVFSDHGMTDTTDTCDLMPRIAATGLRFGVDYAAVYDSTMARFWFLAAGAREILTAALAAEKRGEILSDARLADFGCDFPDRRYGELFFLMRPGVLLCPSFMGETRLAGMHGYDPLHEDSVAMFASNVQTAAPVDLRDLYGLMKGETAP
jgi:predicted AlkP superfamily pyrophosphatase or phosphodiesterase